MSIFETNHAVSFEAKNGLELIVHFGIDTVALNGKGFERIVKVAEGAVKKGVITSYSIHYTKLYELRLAEHVSNTAPALRT